MVFLGSQASQGFPPPKLWQLSSLSLKADSLRVLLVDRAIHTDGGAQPLLALILLDTPQHSCQRGCTQAG